MKHVKSIGRTEGNGYASKVKVSTLQTYRHLWSALGSHSAFVDQALRVAIGGYAYFNEQEYCVLNVSLGGFRLGR